MIYEMIPENNRSTISITSFLVYFSTYLIIIQDNIRLLFKNQMKSGIQSEQFFLFQSQVTRVSAIL